MRVDYEKGREFNYYINCLSKLKKILKKRGYKVSKAQMRLIIMDLSKIDGFEEKDFRRQKSLFMSVISKYVRVSGHTMELAFCQTDRRKRKR